MRGRSVSATEKRPAPAQAHLPAHMTERGDPDRAAESEHPWEESRAEENDRLWHVDTDWSADW